MKGLHRVFPAVLQQIIQRGINASGERNGLNMDMQKPSESHLADLYQAAIEFKQAQLWQWLYDTDLICVENPADRKIGYCSVMGHAGQHFALGVYLGEDGLYGFTQIMRYADKMEDRDFLGLQNCLMCSFEDRNVLSAEDRREIKRMGLSFRGKNEWPQFRRHEPGFHPWYIDDEACVYLTQALRQTLAAAAQIRSGQLRVDMSRGQTICRYSETENGKLVWQSMEIELKFPDDIYRKLIVDDDIIFEKIKKAGEMGNASFQIEFCHVPIPIQENKGERPFYPRLFIILEEKSGMIIHHDLNTSERDDPTLVLNKLINLCLHNGIPQSIKVRSETMAALLKDFCKRAGIQLKIVKKLPKINQIIDSLENWG
jgi:hypothetical protein